MSHLTSWYVTRIFYQLACIGGLVFLINSHAIAIEPVRMGFVDMPRIIEASAGARDAAAETERAADAAREQLKKEQQAIVKMQEEFAKDTAIMSESQRNTRQEEIQARMQAYNKQAADLQEELNRQRLVLAEKALGPVQKVITDIAKEEGLNAIFERTESALLFVDDSMDITDRVIERLKAAEGD